VYVAKLQLHNGD